MASSQYWQKRRAHKRLPRIRSSASKQAQVGITNIVTYKAGMTTLSMLDDSESQKKGIEVVKACTVLEVPKTEFYGIRLYRKSPITGYTITHTEIYDKQIAQKLGIKKLAHDNAYLKDAEKDIPSCSDVSALLVAFPEGTSIGQRHPQRFESAISGKTLEEKFKFASEMLGKEVKPANAFKPGEYIDISSISIGKGWAGVIKRHGVSRLQHKATGKIRHVGTLGAFTPGKVLYTVPHAGQPGFNYRTEYNKRLIKIGAQADAQSINPKQGFGKYGMVKNDYVVIEGSVVGPAKRLVRVRKSIRNTNASGIKEPKILYMKQ